MSKFFKPKITIFFGFNNLNLKQHVARKPFSIRNMEQKEHKNKSDERSQKKLNTVRKSRKSPGSVHIFWGIPESMNHRAPHFLKYFPHVF